MNQLKLFQLEVPTFLALPALVSLAGVFLAGSVAAQTPAAPAPEPSTPAASTPAASTPAAPADAASTPAAPAPAAPADAAPAPAAPEPPKPAAPAPQSMLSKWKLTFYGFVELDITHDSTQSYGEASGAALIARDGTYASEHGRTQFTARDSRIGFRINAPDVGEIKTSGVLEMDFFGNQPPGITNASLVSNGTFRLRQALIRVETPYVDLLFGQAYHVFNWQPFFFPMAVSYFPLLNMPFGRQPQLRISKTIKTEAVVFDVAVSASKPPQINSGVPDLQGGLRIGLPGWKGIRTISNAGMLNDPLSIGVSGLVRQFKVTEFSATPQEAKKATGYGLAVSALVPVIPAASLEEAGNSLTLTGTFFSGSGIADMLGVATNVPYPALPPNAMGMVPAFTPDIDPGMVTYNAAGELETINWQGFMVGAQYYLPPSGKIQIGANYTQGEADQLTAENGWGTYTTFFNKSRYLDVNVFFDATAAFRIGLSYQNANQTYPDDQEVSNNRYMMAFYLLF